MGLQSATSFFDLCSKVFDINGTMEMWRKVWYNRVDKMNLIWRDIMTEFIVQVVIGFFIVVVGVLNTKGHISLLHSYHRKRVKEEDVLPFGKTIGFGTIIVGFTVIVAGISELFFSGITNIILVVGFVPGFIVIVYALLKYNKGIFR